MIWMCAYWPPHKRWPCRSVHASHFRIFNSSIAPNSSRSYRLSQPRKARADSRLISSASNACCAQLYDTRAVPVTTQPPYYRSATRGNTGCRQLACSGHQGSLRTVIASPTGWRTCPRVRRIRAGHQPPYMKLMAEPSKRSGPGHQSLSATARFPTF